MQGIPPFTCTICYRTYNNERSPLILSFCGHTFCKECLEIIFHDYQIVCPECKQVTDIQCTSKLPKNRSLIDMICYHDTELKEKITKNSFKSANKKSNTNSTKNISLLNEFINSIDSFELTYSKIMEENYYLNEIKESFIIKDIDEAFDGLIEIINSYRYSLHKKVKSEFEKVDLIKNFKSSINNYKSKIKSFKEKIQILNYDTNDCNKEIHDKKETILNNELSDENNKKNKTSFVKDSKIDEENLKYNNNINIKEQFNLEKELNDNEMKMEEKKVVKNEKDDQLNSLNISLDGLHLFHENKSKEFFVENEVLKEKTPTIINETKNEFLFELTDEEYNDLITNLEFSKLFNITLNNYSKEIYNPCVFFFINKYQIDSIFDDISKLLPKICDFDSNVYKYNIEEINYNNQNQKTIFKSLIDASIMSDSKKIKYIFDHFKINSNFIYSEVLEKINNTTIVTNNLFEEGIENSSTMGINLAGTGNRGILGNNSNVNNTSLLNRVNISVNQQLNNDENIQDGSNLDRNIRNLMNNTNNSNTNSNLIEGNSTNNNPRSTVLGLLRNNLNMTSNVRVSSSLPNPFNNRNRNINSNSISPNMKDKFFTMHSCLKLFKDKSELKELIKYLIDNYNYIPFKLDIESTLDIKLVKDLDWVKDLSLN